MPALSPPLMIDRALLRRGRAVPCPALPLDRALAAGSAEGRCQMRPQTSASGFGALPSRRAASANVVLLVSGIVRAAPGGVFTELIFLINCGVGAMEECLLG